ncbi:DJ-1/PfpI family protein [Streptomyces sp. TRM 70361]|nr:DJ-1/PfpI family protein [Streptomyces sp. TRM 70361]MEE1939552.1 DJ-1/PfpI family protein [Streptomyces sp. TRM 70361]
MTRKSVLVVLFDGVQSLDVTGPVEVFTGAGRHSGDPYELRTASPDGAPVRTSSGLTLVPDGALSGASGAGAPHTLLVPGGSGTRRPDPRLVDCSRPPGCSRAAAPPRTG